MRSRRTWHRVCPESRIRSPCRGRAHRIEGSKTAPPHHPPAMQAALANERVQCTPPDKWGQSSRQYSLGGETLSLEEDMKTTIGIISIFFLIPLRAESVEASLDFSSLPSSQGWSYFTDSALPESAVFSAASNTLRMNSSFLETAAYYRLGDVVDQSLSFALKTTARVIEGTRALAFYISTAQRFAAISISPTAVYDEANSSIIASLDNTTFHTFDMIGDFVSGYTLFADGTAVGTGTIGVNNVNALYIGDSGSNGSGIAEITRFAFQQPVPVPEVSTFAMALAGLTAIGALTRRRTSSTHFAP